MDLLVLIILSIFSAIFLLFIKANFLVSTLVFFGLPSIFLSSKQSSKILKTCVFSFLMCIPFTFIFDYLIAKDHGWYIVNSVFPWRLFDIVVIEQFIWCFLYIYYVVMFYEYFLDKKEKKTIFHFFPKIKDVISPNMEYFSLFMFMALAFFILFTFMSPVTLQVDYAYLWVGTLLGIMPLSFFLFKFHNFLPRFCKIALYFLFLAILVEYVGLTLNHWVFPGSHFLGMIRFFGFSIPYEEVVMYFALSTPITLSYYEYFDDDRK